MADAATLESLNIEINANSQKASEGVGVLITSLRSLAKAVGTVVPALREMNKGLKELSRYGAIKLPQLPQLGASDSTKQIKEQTSAIQERINAINGIGRAAKSAKESAQWMDKLLTRKEIKERLSGRTGTSSATEASGTVKAAKAVAEEYVPRHAMKHPPITSSSWVSPSNSTYSPPNRPGIRDFSEYSGKDWRRENAEDTAHFNQRLTDIVGQDNALKNLKDNLRPVIGDLKNLSGSAKSAASATNTAGNAIKNTSSALASTSTNAKAATSSITNTSRALASTANNAKTATSTVSSTAESTKEAGKAAEEASHKASGLMQVFSQIGRIAKTMLIRTALKSLMKAFGQSWSAAYEFSHAMGGSFAKSIDQTRTIIADTTTSIIQTFAPILQALVPVFYVVAEAVQYLCQGIQWLLSLIGLSSDLLGANTKKINKYYGDSSKAAKKSAKDKEKANKNLLASWDELNIIQSKNNGVTDGATGGSGGGSGYKPGSLKNIVSDEISAVMSIIVGEAMLAIGLILVCTGHWGIGLGMMAIGAASIAKVLVADWGKLPAKIKSTIATIMTIIGTSFLAIGLILAFTGHVGLGIGLIALGVANLVAINAVAWGEDVTSGVKQTITDIELIAGGAMIALGVILLCCGVVPLGVGMLVAGGIALGSAIALNWDTVKNKVISIMTDIASWFVQKWRDIKATIDFAWDAVKRWWEDTGIGPTVRSVWKGVSDFFVDLWGDADKGTGISGLANAAWTSASIWWTTNVQQNFEKEGIWGGVKGFFRGLFGSPEQRTGIVGMAMNAYDKVSDWWTRNVTAEFEKEGIWGGVKGFFNGLFSEKDGIPALANKAWTAVSKWWEGTTGVSVEETWKGVTDFFHQMFGDPTIDGSIAKFASDSWTAITGIWNATVDEPVKQAWNAVGDFFKTLLFGEEDTPGSIWWYAKKAYEGVSTWWDSSIARPVESAWNGVKTFFTDLFGSKDTPGSIAYYANDCWNYVSTWWTFSIEQPLKDTWKTFEDFFSGEMWTNIKTKASEAWTTVSEWWDASIGKPVEGAWNGFVDFFANIFGGILEDGSIVNYAVSAWGTVSEWWDSTIAKPVEGAWNGFTSFFTGIFGGSMDDGSIANYATSAWETIKIWWSDDAFGNIQQSWDFVKTYFANLWGNADEGTGIAGAFKFAWDEISKLWSDVDAPIKQAWGAIATWFKKNVTDPISDAFKGAINWIIDRVNDVIGGLNTLGSFTLPGLGFDLPFGAGHVQLWNDTAVKLWNIGMISKFAEGGYGIPNGDLFIANEAGAELVGSMDGRTAVANQGQIIEGIQRGVRDANSEQNALLRQQNELLRSLLEKSGEIRVEPSAAWGKFNQRSNEMWGMATGR